MAIRKLDAVGPSQITPGMMVLVTEPNGAGIPEVIAAGGGELYARGAYGRVMEIPGGNGLGVKIHPTMLHDLQPKGYVKLAVDSLVQQVEFDNPNDLLNLAADYLNAYTEQAQPILNSGRQAYVEAAVANLTFEHDRLADLIEAAGFTLDKEIAAPIRNYGEGRLEREAERQRQLEQGMMETRDGDDDGDGDGDDEDEGNDFGIGGENYNPTATVTPLRAGTTDADGVVTLTGENVQSNPDGGATANAFADALEAGRSIGFVVVGEARDGEPVASQGHDAYIPAGVPSIPEETRNVSAQSDFVPTEAAPVVAAEAVDTISLEDLGIGTDLPAQDEEEGGDAPRV